MCASDEPYPAASFPPLQETVYSSRNLIFSSRSGRSVPVDLDIISTFSQPNGPHDSEMDAEPVGQLLKQKCSFAGVVAFMFIVRQTIDYRVLLVVEVGNEDRESEAIVVCAPASDFGSILVGKSEFLDQRFAKFVVINSGGVNKADVVLCKGDFR